MKPFYLIICFLLYWTFTTAQVKVEKTYVTTGLDSTFYSFSEVLKKDNYFSIFFFCPIKNIDTSEYSIKINDFISELKIKERIKINVVFFTQSGKSHNGGLLVKSSDSLFHISEIECYIANYDTLNLIRAENLATLNKVYQATSINNSLNLCRIEIIDAVICFKKYSDRIKFYGDFISEVIFPSYSDREIIDFLRKEIDVLSSKVAKLEQELSNIDQGCKKK